MKHFMYCWLCAVVALCGSASLHAQDIQVADADAAKVYLQDLDIDVKVTGSIATTTWTMVFRNESSRILEGELTFPLAEGITISRYAIDINGRLREAVPIDKARGTTVLEAIEERRVDPGLLERVEGNAFRTRIYPLPAGGTRTVVIGYQELLKHRAADIEYRLPLALKKEVPKVHIGVSVYQGSQPLWDAGSAADIRFDHQGMVWTASKELKAFRSDRPLVFHIPQDKAAATALMQPAGNHFYCLVNTPVRTGVRDRLLSHEPTILWDASLSGRTRNHAAELELLDEYFRLLGRASVHLIVFSNALRSVKPFTVQSGNWSELRKELEGTVYDGGTQLATLDLRSLPGREFLLFSDGLSTYGGSHITPGNKPVYCINSALQADLSALRFPGDRAESRSNPRVLIDLSTGNVKDALRQLVKQPLQLLGVKESADIDELYPSLPVAASEGAVITALSYKPAGSLVLQYGYGSEVTEEIRVELDADRQSVSNLGLDRIWAAQKIAALDMHYAEHRAEIEGLGRRFGLVTRNTSLIVLETLADYITYRIEPPAELRAEYDRAMKARGAERRTARQDRLEEARTAHKDLMSWFTASVTKAAVQVIAPPPPPPAIVRSVGTARREQGRAPAGTIRGKLTDEKGNSIVNANVLVSEGGINKGRDLTDFDGAYTVRPLPAGRYNVKFSYLGRDLTITNVLIGRNSGALVNGRLSTTNEALRGGKGVTVTAVRSYAPPIIDMENPGGRSVKTAEQIDKAPNRNISDIAALSTQTYQGGNSGSINVSGSRSSGTKYVVDGVQLPPGAASFSNQAPGSVETITTFSSGTPARYGPAGGGSTGASFGRDPASYSFDSSLLDNLASLPRDAQYARYLELRESHMQLPSFYFQASAHFLASRQREIGLRVLSNLAELDLENYELYKMLGYKLRELDETGPALEVFRKVADWRPMDPQSLRDYGLALADAGRYQQALDSLYTALTRDIDESLEEDYEGIEEVLLCDIKGLLAAHPAGLHTAKIPKDILRPLSSDIRVVISWNMKDTDIDLWVTDPAGEKCYYGNNNTAAGGRISNDMTDGFGPEQFLLRKAAPGMYKVEVNYFGNSLVKIAGPATVMAEVYTNWGKPNQQRQVIAVQMKPDAEGGVYVGDFSFRKATKG
jgi:hypothetical protein